MLRAIPFLIGLPALAAVCSGQAAGVSLQIESGALELRAAWEGLTDTVYRFEKRHLALREPKPAEERRTHGPERFRRFLPKGAVAVGDVWKVDPKDALPFLSQLHPGATATLHHGRGGSGVSAPGAWACLRAAGATHAEVVLRVHAEFLIEGDGTRGKSSWLTTAQFRGRMLIDRAAKRVVEFELALPDQSANVDVNIRSGRGYIVDIGRFPKMEVRSAAIRVRPELTDAITVDEARRRLRRKFYPFAKIGWLELRDAWKKVKQTGKPLHVVALFGSLDDESC